MSVPEFPGDEFAFEVGQVVTRKIVRAIYGGNYMTGISPSADSLSILLYTKPSDISTTSTLDDLHYLNNRALDKNHDRYHYSGDGKDGDHQFTAGNKTLLESLDNGKIIRLFTNTGSAHKKAEQSYVYRGAYRLDQKDSFHHAPGRGEDRLPRKEIVFHLDRFSTAAPARDSMSPASAQSAGSSQVALHTLSELVPAEQELVTDFTRSASASARSERAERALESRFIAATVAADHSALRYRISIAGEPGYLFTDTWIPETRELVEAKQSASRAHIRVAIGQLLDYARFIEPRPTTLTVLTPELPRPDLLDFIHSQGMTSAFFDGDKLVRLTP